MPRGDEETLAIPLAVRQQVQERDGQFCRMCGRQDENLALHHIEYGGDTRGMGGRRQHDPDKIISVGWLYRHDCHSLIHSNKRIWQPLAFEVVSHPGVTMLQLKRWADARLARERRMRRRA